MPDPGNSKKKNSRDDILDSMIGCLIILLIACPVIFLSYLKYLNIMEKGEDSFMQLSKETFRSIGINTLVVLCLVSVVAILISIQALFSKWRKIRVFISYQHAHKDIVSKLQEKLESRWLNVRFIRFEPAEHDSMILMIENEIRKSDVLLVLPGAYISFVDSEILAARFLHKILIFLMMSDDQTTPDTSLKGYPIFDYKKLEDLNFKPLIRFIFYTNRLWKDTFQNFLRISSGFGKFFFYVYAICYIPSFVLTVIFDLIGSFNVDLEFLLIRYFYWGVTVIVSATFGLSYFNATYQRLRANKVARQKIITGEHTFNHLENGLKYLKNDQQILDALHKGSLILRY